MPRVIAYAGSRGAGWVQGCSWGAGLFPCPSWPSTTAHWCGNRVPPEGWKTLPSSFPLLTHPHHLSSPNSSHPNRGTAGTAQTFRLILYFLSFPWSPTGRAPRRTLNSLLAWEQERKRNWKWRKPFFFLSWSLVLSSTSTQARLWPMSDNVLLVSDSCSAASIRALGGVEQQPSMTQAGKVVSQCHPHRAGPSEERGAQGTWAGAEFWPEDLRHLCEENRRHRWQINNKPTF